MYCPNCGSKNQADMKFCTRCGTNLAVVTEALTGKLAANPLEERAMKVIKDYYKGRRGTMTGAALIPLGILVMTILVLAGMSPIAAFFIICWMFFWGASELAVGLGKWLAAKDEMKVMGYNLPQSFSQQASQEQRMIPEPQANALKAGYSTDPISFPASVTENTTRHLDEASYQPPLENKPKQTQ